MAAEGGGQGWRPRVEPRLAAKGGAEKAAKGGAEKGSQGWSQGWSREGKQCTVPAPGPSPLQRIYFRQLCTQNFYR